MKVKTLYVLALEQGNPNETVSKHITWKADKKILLSCFPLKMLVKDFNTVLTKKIKHTKHPNTPCNDSRHLSLSFEAIINFHHLLL